MPIDFKKTEKALYQPPTTPSIIDVPAMTFLMVDGSGNPNTSAQYSNALEILYGLSYSIKMSKMSNASKGGVTQPEGYYEYVVPPLEGLWWLRGGGDNFAVDKDRYCWTSMIRQPEFVTPEVFEFFKMILAKKKPKLDLSLARLETFTEGLCVQAMHIGPYDDEPATIAAMERYVAENGYAKDVGGTRRHHEIYLADPRKTAPEKLRTVIRVPVRRT